MPNKNPLVAREQNALKQARWKQRNPDAASCNLWVGVIEDFEGYISRLLQRPKTKAAVAYLERWRNKRTGVLPEVMVVPSSPTAVSHD